MGIIFCNVFRTQVRKRKHAMSNLLNMKPHHHVQMLGVKLLLAQQKKQRLRAEAAFKRKFLPTPARKSKKMVYQ